MYEVPTGVKSHGKDRRRDCSLEDRLCQTRGKGCGKVHALCEGRGSSASGRAGARNSHDVFNKHSLFDHLL